MEQEFTFMEFQPFANFTEKIPKEQALQKRSFSQENPREIIPEESPSIKSQHNTGSRESEFRNFAKHYSKTIKNIIKDNILAWPLDEITQSIAKKITQALDRNSYPPRKMVDAILCRNINTSSLKKVGYEELVELFSSSQLQKSCQKIRELTFSYINSQKQKLMVGRRIVNSELFLEYFIKVTRTYENQSRFSFRLRPQESRQIRKKIQQRRLGQQALSVRQQSYQNFEEDKYFEKFAQSQSNFLGCI